MRKIIRILWYDRDTEEGELMEQLTVLVVDDDREIVDSIAIFLQAEGYAVEKAYNGLEALDAVMTRPVHLLVLDIMMPEMDGIKTLMKVRESKNIPIILLSAKSEDADKILGLTAGADDYITKPFNPSELVARVKSQLRRYTQLGAMQTTEKQIVIRGLVLDTESKSVTVDGEPVRMTPLEYKILELLCRHPGKVFSTEEIYRQVWNDEVVSDNAIAVHIRHIREKIEINPKEPRYLKVVWGVGYKRGANEHEKGGTVANTKGHCVCAVSGVRGGGHADGRQRAAMVL